MAGREAELLRVAVEATRRLIGQRVGTPNTAQEQEADRERQQRLTEQRTGTTAGAR